MQQTSPYRLVKGIPIKTVVWIQPSLSGGGEENIKVMQNVIALIGKDNQCKCPMIGGSFMFE